MNEPDLQAKTQDNQSRAGAIVDPASTVSIIIPAYNVAPFIKEALDSVLSQTFSDYEVIVINDGSPDTPALEQALEPYRNRIHYLEQDNQGAGAARNAGLRAARGRFVAFLDGDDVYLPTFLSEQMELLLGGESCDLVYADATNFGDSGSSGSNMDFNPSAGAVTAESLICGRCNIITSTVVARRDLVLKTGFFDETLRNSQDFDLWIRLAKQGARINYQKRILLRRRIYAGSLAADPAKSFEGEIRVLQKTRLRNDLTAAEQAAVDATLKRRLADVEVIRGKRSLLAGDINAAVRSFRFANEYFNSLKLRIVLVSLRLAPGLVRRIYGARPT
jgi:glycosyltransferase involved in cell wall biosynthesis